MKIDLLSSPLIVIWQFDCPIATAYHLIDQLLPLSPYVPFLYIGN